MDIQKMLNFLKWQIKIRLPHNDLYERAFTKIDDNELLRYIYYLDIYDSRLLRYLFGSYLISEDALKEFYKYLDKEFGDYNHYNFKIDGMSVKLPKPEEKDYDLYRDELMDLILPYVAGYPSVDVPFHEGPYESDNVYLKENDIVFDCGANIGMFSAFASAKGCFVYAFEPTEYTYDKYLSKTISLNQNITRVDKALTNKDGTVEFILNSKNIGCNKIPKSKKSIYPKTIVNTTTIDNFVSNNNINRVDFIKADIEGAERLMLEGAKKTLREYAPSLSICYYHLLDDYKVLTNLIKEANSDYEIDTSYKKIYAYVKHR